MYCQEDNLFKVFQAEENLMLERGYEGVGRAV
jgi:hypothetical protein